MDIPEVGDRYIDTRIPLTYRFCTKRTRDNGQIYIWDKGGYTPLEFCQIIRFDVDEAVEFCMACTVKEQGIAIKSILERMKLSREEKIQLWARLPAEKQVLLKP